MKQIKTVVMKKTRVDLIRECLLLLISESSVFSFAASKLEDEGTQYHIKFLVVPWAEKLGLSCSEEKRDSICFDNIWT